MNYQRWDQSISWNKERVTSALTVCDAVYQSELIELGHDLNEYHRVSWSTAQHEKLFGYWLRTFIHVLYDRWHGLDARTAICEPRTPRSIVNLLNPSAYHTSDELNENLYLQLVTLRESGRLGRLPLPDRLVFSASYQVLGRGRTPVEIHNPYHSYGIPQWRRRLTSGSVPRRLKKLASPIAFRQAPATSHIVDADWRLSRSGSQIAGFAEACSVLVRVHAPAVLLEGFRSMQRAAPRHPATYLYTANSHIGHTSFRFLSAQWHNQTRLLTHQHGGGFGLDRHCVAENHGRAVADRFYTWGWSEGPSTSPLPVPPRVRCNPPTSRSGILLKCVNYPRYAYKIMYQEMAGANQALIERTIRFVRNLAGQDLEVSLYPHDYG
ncbi:MAG: hypothetical protein QGI09_08055, partial [Dehalococcoidia bacterium]|nr:hypothetical protein [Dehalococcoidia bacterium]